MPTSPAENEAAPPGLHWYLTEPGRSFVDFGQLAAARSVLRTAPRGDGHPVLVLPGLLASDASTTSLRWFLGRLGYPAHRWNLGRNVGPTRAAVDGIRGRLRELSARHGQAVSLIGWSLGGIYARELAREMPFLVRDVITLGSPYRLHGPAGTPAHRVFRLLSHLHIPDSEMPPPEHTRPPLLMPVTSVYSERDGIVPWQACIETPGPRRQNVAVTGSHLGYGHNPAVLWLAADRLALAPGHWQPFVPPEALARHYPADDTRRVS
ncbi:esterase/lipase family protein [Kribbella sp. NPDC051586]|uniref:esterase/lipase family protein n=1 Tax=Kribbella sp. NPDC051586 TaxID=3364118 RepID=UPI0037B5D816